MALQIAAERLGRDTCAAYLPSGRRCPRKPMASGFCRKHDSERAGEFVWNLDSLGTASPRHQGTTQYGETIKVNS
jgi:hypothetical protein